jgi:hypothetical protein
MPSAHVTAVERTTDDDGTPVTIVRVDLGGDDPISAELALAPGDDSPPLAGDVASTTGDGGTGTEFATGFQDTKNAGTAQPGEKRFYGRDADGNVVNEYWLKGDGSVSITNKAGGSIVMGADGVISLNGFKIDLSGNAATPGKVDVDGEVTAMAQGAAIELSQHVHPDAMGGTAPPTPGT